MSGNTGFRIFAGIVFVLVVVGGAVALGWSAYNMGLAQGVAQSGVPVAPQSGAPAPAPFYYGPYPPYLFRPHGFGFLGSLTPLFFLFLAFVLFRIVFWGGMGRHQHWGWGAKGPFPPDGMPSHWREMAERWHLEQHGQGSGLKEGETTV